MCSNTYFSLKWLLASTITSHINLTPRVTQNPKLWSYYCGYKVISLTCRICFIYLPIPVTGPEGPSMSLVLVLSWEHAFYEISVASQKSVILVFLEWFTFLVFYCLFFTVLLRTFIGVKSGIMMCGLASSGDMMNFLVESGWRTWIFFQFGKTWHELPITKFASTLCLKTTYIMRQQRAVLLDIFSFWKNILTWTPNYQVCIYALP